MKLKKGHIYHIKTPGRTIPEELICRFDRKDEHATVPEIFYYFERLAETGIPPLAEPVPISKRTFINLPSPGLQEAEINSFMLYGSELRTRQMEVTEIPIADLALYVSWRLYPAYERILKERA